MSTVAVVQSNYLPWKGYFDIIHDVDLFVFYDDVQYTKNDWRNRNWIKSPAGPQWLTVPVSYQFGDRIDQVRIPNHHWQRKHYTALEQYYGKQPGFAWLQPMLEEVYLRQHWENLSALNRTLCERISGEYLGIQTRFDCSSRFTLPGNRQQRLLALLEQLGASRYLSGPAARAYIEPQAFAERGIELCYKDYSGYPEYPQPYPPFSHQVSVLDLLFCVGPAAGDFIWGWRQQ